MDGRGWQVDSPLVGEHNARNVAVAVAVVWFGLLGYGGIRVAVIWLVGLATTFVISLVRWVGLILRSDATFSIGTFDGWWMPSLPIAPAVVDALFFTRTRDDGTVPDAIDKLAAGAAAAALSRYFATNPSDSRPDSEVRFVSFGREEAGLRGSRRYVAPHLEELKQVDARVLSMEMVADPEIGILTSDANGFVEHAPEVVQSLVLGAEHASVPSASMGVGTNAAPAQPSRSQPTAVLPYTRRNSW